MPAISVGDLLITNNTPACPIITCTQQAVGFPVAGQTTDWVARLDGTGSQFQFDDAHILTFFSKTVAAVDPPTIPGLTTSRLFKYRMGGVVPSAGNNGPIYMTNQFGVVWVGDGFGDFYLLANEVTEDGAARLYFLFYEAGVFEPVLI